MAPSTHSSPGEVLTAVSTLRAFQHLACQYFTNHRDLIAAFWVRGRFSTCVEACSTCFGVADLKTSSVTQQPHFPLQPNWRTLPPLTLLHQYIIVCFIGLCVVLRHLPLPCLRPALPTVVPAGRSSMFCDGHLPEAPSDVLPGPPDDPAPGSPCTDSICTWCQSDLTHPEVP
jgi:hypothetical protein